MTMNDAGLIPVTIKAIGENGKGNISLQLIAQDGGLLPPWLPGAHIDLFIPEIGRASILSATKITAGNIMKSA